MGARGALGSRLAAQHQSLMVHSVVQRLNFDHSKQS